MDRPSFSPKYWGGHWATIQPQDIPFLSQKKKKKIRKKAFIFFLIRCMKLFIVLENRQTLKHSPTTFSFPLDREKFSSQKENVVLLEPVKYLAPEAAP